MREDVFSWQRYRLCEQSKRVRESFSCRQAHPRGVMRSRTIYRPSIPVIQGVVESPSNQTTWPTNVYTAILCETVSMGFYTRRWYVELALTALLKQPFHFYKFRTTLYSFNSFVDANERCKEILTQRTDNIKKINVANVMSRFITNCSSSFNKSQNYLQPLGLNILILTNGYNTSILIT